MKNTFSLKAVVLALAVFALVGVAFSSTKAMAKDDPEPAAKSDDFTWEYDAKEDAVVITCTSTTTGPSVKYTIADLKGNDTAKVSKATATKDIAVGSSAAFYLNTKTGGIKVKETKNVTLFITSNKFETKCEYSAIVTVQASSVKKLVPTIDYSKATTLGQAVNVVYYTVDDSKTAVDADPDKVEWAPFNKSKKMLDGYDWDTCDHFDGVELDKLLKLDGVKVYFRIAGANGTTTAQRPSATKAVTLKKYGKQVSVKFNTKTNAFPIKNGYDYCVVASGSSLTPDAWVTILPYNKNSDRSNAFISTESFIPSKWNKDDDAKNVDRFTQTKVKSVTLDDLGIAGGDVYVYFRKSATVSKPSTVVSTSAGLYLINAKQDAPEVESFADAKGKDEVTIKASGADQYAIVTVSDYNSGKIDSSSIAWSKFSSTKIKASITKTSKYKVEGEEKAEARSVSSVTECVVLVRKGSKANITKTGISKVDPASDVVAVGNFTVITDSDSQKEKITGFEVIG